MSRPSSLGFACRALVAPLFLRFGARLVVNSFATTSHRRLRHLPRFQSGGSVLKRDGSNPGYPSALRTRAFSERKLTFTFAICCRPSVVCRLSVVCNVRAPYLGDSNFRQYFYGIWYLGHPLTSSEHFTEIDPGEPLRRGS